MPTAKIILYKQKVLKDGTHPIVVQIIHDRKVKRKSTGLSCKPEEWNSENSCFTKAFSGHKDYNKKLDSWKAKLGKTIDWFELNEEHFSYEKFKEKVTKPKSRSKAVLEAFDEIINRMRVEGRIGNSFVYRDTKNDLKRFLGPRQIVFQDIDYTFLSGFESFLKVQGYADSSIHNRMRTLRAVYNEAIRLKYTSVDYYPFSRNPSDTSKYSLNRLVLTSNPRALTKDEWENIKAFEVAANPHLQLSYDLFLFSFYTNGMNFTDMANLRWSDINNDRIRYKRQKVKVYFDIKVRPEVRDILNHYSSLTPNSYVFPILNAEVHKTPASKKDRIKKSLKKMNRDLAEIAQLLGIQQKVTSYTSRHTYAMALLWGGKSKDDISHQLGHTNTRTTERYISKLDTSYYDEINDVLP